MVAARVIVFIDARPIAREARERHARAAAVGQGLSVDVEMSRLIEALGGSKLVGAADHARAAVETPFHRPAGVAAVIPRLAIGRDDVPVRVELLFNLDRRRLR